MQATDDFIRLLAQSCLNTYTGKCTLLMSYFPCVFFLYNAIEMLHGIFESLVKAGYIMYEFHFRRLKEALLGKGSAVKNYWPKPTPHFSDGESEVSSKVTL